MIMSAGAASSARAALRFPNSRCLAVNNTVPANSVAEFIKYVKANPGKISYGSLSAGTPSHFLGAMFNRSTGTDILHVPYRGSGPATVALLANEVHAVFNTTAASMEMYKAGKIKLLAVTGAERSPALPDVPTFRELKLDLGAIEEADMWYGFLAPGKMPRATVLELNGMIRKALDDPTVRARLLTLDIEAVTDTPEDFAKIVRDDYERWGGIIRASGFTLSE